MVSNLDVPAGGCTDGKIHIFGVTHGDGRVVPIRQLAERRLGRVLHIGGARALICLEGSAKLGRSCSTHAWRLIVEHIRDNVCGAPHDHRVAGADVSSMDLVRVMEGCCGDGDATAARLRRSW